MRQFAACVLLLATCVSLSNGGYSPPRSGCDVRTLAVGPACNQATFGTISNIQTFGVESHTLDTIAAGCGALSADAPYNDTYTNVSLPFPVSYLGRVYHQVFVHTNGFIMFDNLEVYCPVAYPFGVPMGQGSCYRPSDSSSFEGTEGTDTWNRLRGGVGLAAAWSAWKDVTVNCGVVGTAPNRRFVVQWLGYISNYNETVLGELMPGQAQVQVAMSETSSNITTTYPYLPPPHNNFYQYIYGHFRFLKDHDDWEMKNVVELDPAYTGSFTVQPVCGNGILDGTEECDTGVTSSPACIDCVCQPGYVCNKVSNIQTAATTSFTFANRAQLGRLRGLYDGVDGWRMLSTVNFSPSSPNFVSGLQTLWQCTNVTYCTNSERFAATWDPYNQRLFGIWKTTASTSYEPVFRYSLTDNIPLPGEFGGLLNGLPGTGLNTTGVSAFFGFDAVPAPSWSCSEPGLMYLIITDGSNFAVVGYSVDSHAIVYHNAADVQSQMNLHSSCGYPTGIHTFFTAFNPSNSEVEAYLISDIANCSLAFRFSSSLALLATATVMNGVDTSRDIPSSATHIPGVGLTFNLRPANFNIQKLNAKSPIVVWDFTGQTVQRFAHEFLAYPEGISVSGHETTWLENFCCSQQCANGKCSSVTRQCECYPGFSGPSCSIFSFNVTGPSDMRGVLLYHTSALQDFHCFDPSNGSTLKRLYVDTAPIDPSTLASRTPALVISEESLSYSGGSFFFPNATIQKYIGTTSPTTIYGVVADVHCYYDSATFQSDIPIFRVDAFTSLAHNKDLNIVQPPDSLKPLDLVRIRRLVNPGSHWIDYEVINGSSCSAWIGNSTLPPSTFTSGGGIDSKRLVGLSPNGVTPFSDYPIGTYSFNMTESATWWFVGLQRTCTYRLRYNYVPAADRCDFSIAGMSCVANTDGSTSPIIMTMTGDVEMDGDFVLEEGATLDIGGYSMKVSGDVVLNGLVRSTWKPAAGSKRAEDGEYGVVASDGNIDFNNTYYIVVIDKADIDNKTVTITYTPFHYETSSSNISLAAVAINGQDPSDCDYQNATMTTTQQQFNVLVLIDVVGSDKCDQLSAGIIAAIVVSVVAVIVIIIIIIYLASPSCRRRAAPYKDTQE